MNDYATVFSRESSRPIMDAARHRPPPPPPRPRQRLAPPPPRAAANCHRLCCNTNSSSGQNSSTDQQQACSCIFMDKPVEDGHNHCCGSVPSRALLERLRRRQNDVILQT